MLALGLIAALILVGILPSLAVGRYARQRGRRFWPWFLAGVLLWPVAIIVLLAIGEPREPRPLDQLAQLGQLRADGILTEDEFNAQKARLLAE